MQQSHANGETMRYLLLDGGLRSVSDCGVYLQAAHHRAGVHDERFGSEGCETFGVELIAIDVVVLVECQTGETFALNAEHHGDVGLGECAVEVAFDLDSWG